MNTIAQEYDCLLIDLDGTVFRGAEPTAGAVRSLDEVHGRKLFVTNNASRSADQVAAHLRELGFTATGADVVTSAQSAAHLLAGELPPESAVLIVGTDRIGQRNRRRRTASGAPVRGRAGRRRPGPVHDHRLARSCRGGPGHPGRSPVGGRQRRPHLAHRAWPAARQRIPGRRPARGHRHRTAGGGQTGACAASRRAGPRRLPCAVGDRRPTGHRHRGRQRRRAAQPDGADRGQHRARRGASPNPSSRPTYIGHDLRSLHQDGELLAVGPQPGWHVDVGDGRR